MDEQLDALQQAASGAVHETIGQYLDQLGQYLHSFLTWDNFFRLIGAIIIISIIGIIKRVIKHGIKKVPEEKLERHYSVLICKFINYICYILIAMYVLSLFGVKLSAVWGAAGIAGVALGFAAQTSVSNLICGLFVLGEKTMKIGDFITVGGISGTVDSIGLLSVKVHTPDNMMVRIPNSAIINSNFQNANFYSVRRFSFETSIDYSSDMEKVLEVLKSVPAKCPVILQEPAASVWYDGFGDSGIKIVLACYFKPSDLITAKNQVYIAIKKAFDEAGISIPFNRLDVAMVK